jgi:hypothetical protein
MPAGEVWRGSHGGLAGKRGGLARFLARARELLRRERPQARQALRGAPAPLQRAGPANRVSVIRALP